MNCKYKISSPKTTIIATDDKTEDGLFVVICEVCSKRWFYQKLPEKLRKD